MKETLFARITLRQKVAGLACIVLALSWIVGAFEFMGQSAMKKHGDVLAMSNAMLEARRSEKDFLSRKDIKYAGLVDEAVARFDSLFSQYGTYEGSSELRSDMQEYASSFHELVRKNQECGLDENSGLQGKFRTAVHAVEDAVKKQNNNIALIAMLQARRSEKDFMLRGGDEYVGKVQAAVDDLRRSGTAEVRHLADEYVQAFGQLVETNREVVKVTENLRSVVHKTEPILAEMTRATEERASSFQSLSTIVMILSSIISIVLSIIVPGTIIKPLKRLSESSKQIAAGDLTVDVSVESSNDELGEMTRSFKSMVDNLRETVRGVGEASEAVASASSQISASTEEMAAGAQEQTSQASEVASAVEEMTKTIVENSRNASNTADTAKVAKDAAQQGGDVVNETVTGMRRIADVVKRSAETVKALGKSSDQIGEIIGVIDDIADQTNLLALNAAIEAARAGEQGRGFAVVADEVRKLAERTTKATKEIAGMIKSIQADTTGAVTSMAEGTKQVDDGIKLADKAGSSLKEIVEVSEKVTDMVAQIAAASEQQSSASEQISKNVEAISSVTNQTASGVQQIARAAEDLNRLTENLRQSVARFKLGDDGSPGHHQAVAQKSVRKPMAPKSRVAVRANGALVPHEGA